MRLRPLPLIIWSVVLLLVITTAVTMIINGPQDLGVEPQSPSQRWLQLVTAMSAATAGAVILSHHRGNVIAWLFMALGLAGGATELAISYAATCQSPHVCNLGLLVVMDALWFPTLAIGLSGLFLLFPAGRVPPTWRAWLWWALVVSGALGAGTAFFQGEVYHLAGAVNPWAGLIDVSLASGVADAAGVLVVLVGLTAIIDFVLRSRRASGMARLQNRWLAYSGLLVVLAAIANIVGEEIGVELGWAWSLATASIPVAVAFAITQHRLYEIDRLFARTVSYSVVIGLLAGAFAVVVVGIPNWIPGLGDSPLLVAIGTLVVAAGFNPLRRQVQELVDRRFNRSRYDAQNVMEVFAGSLHRRVGTDEVIDGWVEVVESTMEPAAIGVWVRG